MIYQGHTEGRQDDKHGDRQAYSEIYYLRLIYSLIKNVSVPINVEMKYSFLNSHIEALSKKESTSSRQVHLKHNKKKETHFKSQYA